MSTWFKKGRGLALGILAGALVVGNAMPHLVNGLGGLDWRLVIYVTSTLTLAGGLITEFAVKEGPFPFPRAIFDPRQAGRVFSNRGVRLASFGYFGHMWELFAMLRVVFGVLLRSAGGPGSTGRLVRCLCDVCGHSHRRLRLLDGRHIGRPLGQDQDDRCDDGHIRKLRRAHRVALRRACVASTARELGVGVCHRGGLGSVLDNGHGALRSSLRRDGSDAATRRGLRPHRADDLAHSVLRRCLRVALGFRVLGPGTSLGCCGDAQAKVLAGSGPHRRGSWLTYSFRSGS
jgi:hypothetical protein